MNKEYIVLDGDDVYSICTKATGGLDNIISFLNNNNIIKSFNQDLNRIVSSTVLFPENLIQKKEYSLNFEIDNIDSQIKSVLGLEGQSTFDLCMQSYGSLNNYTKFINDSGCNNKTDAYNLLGIFDKRLINDSLLVNQNSRNDIVYSTLHVNVADITPSSLNKNFEDGEIFVFEDGIIFDFE